MQRVHPSRSVFPCARLRLLKVAALVFAMLGAGNAAATALYEYFGNIFVDVEAPYTMSHFLHAQILLASELPANQELGPVTPLAFLFSDGIHRVEDSTPGLASSQFEFRVVDGMIANWISAVVVLDASGEFLAMSSVGGTTARFDMQDVATFGSSGSAARGSNTSMPGAWGLLPTPVAEPASIALYSVGLLGLAWAGRRRRKPQATLAA